MPLKVRYLYRYRLCCVLALVASVVGSRIEILLPLLHLRFTAFFTLEDRLQIAQPHPIMILPNKPGRDDLGDEASNPLPILTYGAGKVLRRYLAHLPYSTWNEQLPSFAVCVFCPYDVVLDLAVGRDEGVCGAALVVNVHCLA